MRNTLSIFLIIISIGFTAGCTQSGNNNSDELALLAMSSSCRADVRKNTSGISVVLSPQDSWLMYPGTALPITATVINDVGSQGVSWNTPSPGSLTGTTTSSPTYNAPASETSLSDVVTITATSIADVTKTASLKVTIIPDTGTNIQQITVTATPVTGAAYYPNAAFATVKICPAGSVLNCTTVDGILIDTGSYGLRVLESALNPGTISNLAKEPGTSGGTVLNNCAQFMDGSSLWGWVAKADVGLGNTLTAQNTPIQVVSDTYAIPSACGSVNDSTPALLGSNGILGVGTEQTDCGSSCTTNATVYYYECNGGGCTQDTASLSSQVINPIANFSSGSYNNGVILAIPSVNGTAATLTGSMIFGITTGGTNNALSGGAQVFTLDSYGLFSTIYKSRSHPYSFIDSGSNGIFFDDHSIRKDAGGWYAPPCTLDLRATNVGTNSVSGSVAFIVGNADTLQNTGDAALPGLAAPAGGSQYFDWGFPFFFGRVVYTSIRDTAAVGSYTPPFWAY